MAHKCRLLVLLYEVNENILESWQFAIKDNPAALWFCLLMKDTFTLHTRDVTERPFCSVATLAPSIPHPVAV